MYVCLLLTRHPLQACKLKKQFSPATTRRRPRNYHSRIGSSFNKANNLSKSIENSKTNICLH